MSKPKKLDLPLEKLIEIAKALNENTIANKKRSKEEKITTDKFIRKFGIVRKDFSETIKDTEIKYNNSTFLYDIPEVNFSTTKVNLNEVYQSSEKVNQLKPLKNKEVYQNNTESILATKEQSVPSTPKNTFELPEEIKELIYLRSELKEMLDWYKKQTNTNIIDIPEIDLSNKKLTGEVVPRSYKIYKSVADDFKKFSEGRKESIKDLVSLALVEFMDKYKR